MNDTKPDVASLPAKLLPCPFCGETPNIGTWKHAVARHPGATAIECSGDLFDCPVNPTATGYTQEEAIAAWNRRLASPEQPGSSVQGEAEPVGTVMRITTDPWGEDAHIGWHRDLPAVGTKLYTTPPPAPAAEQGDTESRFFLDHGVVHDRKTGQHVGAAFEDDAAERLLALLRRLELDRDAWRMTASACAATVRTMEAQPEAPAAEAKVIRLTSAEIQSGVDRVRWAEGLIRQLPADHDGRNSWLINYGTSAGLLAAAEQGEECQHVWQADKDAEGWSYCPKCDCSRRLPATQPEARGVELHALAESLIVQSMERDRVMFSGADALRFGKALRAMLAAAPAAPGVRVENLANAAGSWGDFFKAYHRAAESGLSVDWERAAEKAMQWQRRVSAALDPFAKAAALAPDGGEGE